MVFVSALGAHLCAQHSNIQRLNQLMLTNLHSTYRAAHT